MGADFWIHIGRFLLLPTDDTFVQLLTFLWEIETEKNNKKEFICQIAHQKHQNSHPGVKAQKKTYKRCSLKNRICC